MYAQNNIRLIIAALAVIVIFTACNSGKYETPIIPIEDFFRNPEKTGFQISPDGNNISFLKPWENRQNIYVQPVDAKEMRRITSSNLRDIKYYFWAADDMIIYLNDEAGDDNYEIYSVNIADSSSRRLTNFEGATSYIIDPLVDIEDELLIALNLRKKEIFDVYRINIKSGDITLAAENPGNITNWITDNSGKIRIAISTDGVNEGALYRENENEPFEKLFETNFKEYFAPLAFTFDNRYIIASSNIGHDLAAIVKYDPREKKEIETIFRHPEVDVEQILRSKKKQIITGVSFTTWKKEYHFFDKDCKKLFAYLNKKLPGYEITIESRDRDENKLLIRTSSDKSLGAYYYFNRETKEFKKLADVSPWLNQNVLADMKSIRYISRDGLTIHGYLTLPRGRKPNNLPVIVFPHGGLWRRDTWGFRREVQFFANRGYAVLQMNFRGSQGYGKKFFEAGFKEWGRKMQDDITDGVNWLIRQEIADPDRIAIYGGSLGGYASLCGMIKTPELYRCGISVAAIVDISEFLNSVPPYWKPFREMLYEMFGNPVSDSLYLREVSPIFHADKVRAPMLIAHGANDSKCSISEVDKMVEMLKKNRIKVTYIVKENEGHGFKNEENRIDLYKNIEIFLAKNLRGRVSSK